MRQALQGILEANQRYAAGFGAKSDLAGVPRRRVAILTCMDARLDPLRFTGLNEGDAHVIRNAGGRATDDAIRSLVISHKLLGTLDWLVIHHSDCGMQSLTDAAMARLLENSLETAEMTSEGWRNPDRGGGSTEGHFVKWLTISEEPQSLIGDVSRIRRHPLVSPTVSIHGFIFDVKKGQLVEVPEASRIGQAAAEDRSV